MTLHAHAASVRPLAQGHRLAGDKTAMLPPGASIAAVVFNLVRDEEAIAAIADFHLAVVDDAGQRRRTVEHPRPTGVLRGMQLAVDTTRPGGAGRMSSGQNKTPEEFSSTTTPLATASCRRSARDSGRCKSG